MVYCIWRAFSPETTLRYAIMSFATLIVCSATFVVVVISIPPTPYLEECRVLAYETEFVSLNECMEYVRYNSDATGAQIIDALIEKNKKVPPIEDLLDRPLNP